MRLAIFAALPQEIKLILKKLNSVHTELKTPFKIFSSRRHELHIILILSGMGVDHADQAANYILEEYKPDVIISIGFGGALYQDAEIGDLIWAPRVLLVSDSIKDSLELPGARVILSKINHKTVIHEGTIVTLEKWIKKADIKQALSKEIPYGVCDMETFPIAKRSLQKMIPFYAIRAITDTGIEEIPFQPDKITNASGNYAVLQAVMLILQRPFLLPKIIKLGKNSYRASKKLCYAVESMINILSKNDYKI
jgi:adenosylhomocysteine nucleosidase